MEPEPKRKKLDDRFSKPSTMSRICEGYVPPNTGKAIPYRRGRAGRSTESARAWLRASWAILIPMQTSWKIFILMRPISLRSLVLALSALLKLELVRLQVQL